MKNIQVIEEWVLVKPEKVDTGEKVLPSGLVIPAEVANKRNEVKRALVIQISHDVEFTGYKEGDTVLYYGKTGIPVFDTDGTEYAFLKHDGMLAIEVKKNEAN
jgi:co-chaperonin GroES (HSP10)